MRTPWQLFAANVDAAPNAPALIFKDDVFDFGELRDAAERTARGLWQIGIRPGDVVAIELFKTFAAYVVILACLRLGVSYVCLDPANPPSRRDRILDRVRPRVSFAHEPKSNPYGEHRIVEEKGLEGVPAADDDCQTEIPECTEATASDPTYIMFTSGSTGEPKGAVIQNGGVRHLMQWGRTLLQGREAQRFTAINPLHFDNSVFDLYCGLLNGSAIVPVETGKMKNPLAWVRAIRAGRATVMFAVPTLFLILSDLGLLTAESLPEVRMFLFGGEGFPVEALKTFHKRFDHQARLVNVYGPTETTCICSSVEITQAAFSPAMRFASLGRMHPGFSYAVLDSNRHPVPRGEAGELWIGGPCVALGYFDNPEETARHFIQNPMHDHYRDIWYRTGDLVVEDNDAQLWFRGRVDHQIKIRGHRIELEEIDLAIEAIPGVTRALTAQVDGSAGKELAVIFTADREIGFDEIFDACKARLPQYMLPARAKQTDELPVNANGKADRRAIVNIFG